jgi:lipopolysaccharide export system permease protein
MGAAQIDYAMWVRERFSLLAPGHDGEQPHTSGGDDCRHMRIFARYLFGQAAGALVLILLSLTGVVWIATALKQLNVVTGEGQQAWQFIKMTLLAIPNLMAIIAPVALLIAALHTLNKLNGDSELIVMTASGATVWYFAKPLVLLASFVAAGVLIFNLYVMPWSARALGDMFVQLRTDLIGQALQPGRFSNPEPGLIFHIRDRDSRSGLISGLVMHDTRETDQVATYLAERGEVVKQGTDAFLIMKDGHIIRQNKADPIPKIIVFDRYIVDLVRFKPKEAASELRPRERYLDELWNPSTKDLAAPAAIVGKMRAELHDRLSAPIYPFAFVMIVIAAVGVAQTTRQNRAKNLVGAFAIATGVRIGGFAAINMLAIKPNTAPLVYAVPIGALILATGLAAHRMRPRRTSRVAGALQRGLDRLGWRVRSVLALGGARRAAKAARPT